MKRLIAIGVVVFVAAAIYSSISFVGADEAAVLDPRFGDPQILERGLHFHLPFLSRVTHYPLKPEKVESQAKLETRDNLNFNASYTLESSFDPDTLLAFHARRGGRPLETVRRQAGDEAVKEAAAQLRADEILGAATPERWKAVLIPPCRKAGLRPVGISVQPVAAAAMVNAAIIYQQRNLPRAALNLAKMAVDRYGSDPMAHYGLGRIYAAQGRGEEAEAEFVQALFLDPAAKEPMGELVGRLLKRKDFSRAQRVLAAALEKDRASAPHYNWMGITMQLQGRLDEARVAFQKAVELDPKSAEYRANLGALELARADAKSAEESLKEAIRIDPNHSLALYNLGIAVAEQGRNAEAVPFFERAEKSGPATVGLLNALARAYREIGDLPRAAATLRRSLAMKPDQPEQQKLLKQLGPVKSPT
jgi:Flp pilus assembly protein TadD